MITRDEALEGLTELVVDENPSKDGEIADGESALVEIEGRRKYFELRSSWSSYIASWISALIIFNGGLAVGVGSGWLAFENMQWFITAVTVETFLQIVGMGYIAVRFLFSHK